MKLTHSAATVAKDTQVALAAVTQSEGPILVGPWLGEVGYELLYWIPFVRWMLDESGVDPSRLWVVSRGGCRSWYADLTSQYLDLYDYFTPTEIRAQNRERIRLQGQHGKKLGLREGQATAKQHEISALDRLIIARITPAIGAPPQLWHPSVLYHLLRPYWRRRGPNLYDEHMRVRLMTPPPRLAGLPASYVAMKFYTSQACRGDRRHWKRVGQMLEILLASHDVVAFIDPTVYDDDHLGAFPLADHPRLRGVPLDPATNLETQTAVIGHAEAFVGTYGGFAYLAPLLGVPTLACYADYNFRGDHLRLAQRITAQYRVPFDVLPLEAGVERLRREWRWWTHAA